MGIASERNTRQITHLAPNTITGNQITKSKLLQTIFSIYIDRDVVAVIGVACQFMIPFNL